MIRAKTRWQRGHAQCCPPAKRLIRKQLPLGAIIGLALLLRLLLVLAAEWQPRSDTRDYHEFALNLINGNGYVNHSSDYREYLGFVQRAFRPPGYPLTLALVYTVCGFRPLCAMMVNVFAELVTILALLLMAQSCMDRRYALAVTALYSLCATWTPSLMTESVFACAFLSALLLIHNGTCATRYWGAALLGLLVCYAVMVRPIGVVLLVPVVVSALTNRRRAALVRTAIAVLPTVLFLLIWLARNYSLYGEVFLTSNANLHRAGSYGIDHLEALSSCQSALGRMPNEAELNAHIGTLIEDRKRQDWFLGARVYLTHLVDLFRLRPAWELSGLLWETTYRGHPDVGRLHKALYSLYFLIYPLGVIGFAAYVRRHREIAVVAVSFILLHAYVSDGNVRFMAPLIPVLCLYAGLAVSGAGALLAKSRASGTPSSLRR